jgi:lactate dehydrogenase-like 2-hydroxyacid dehydrogenase
VVNIRHYAFNTVPEHVFALIFALRRWFAAFVPSVINTLKFRFSTLWSHRGGRRMVCDALMPCRRSAATKVIGSNAEFWHRHHKQLRLPRMNTCKSFT